MMRLDRLVEAWAEYAPDHIAVESVIEKITYRELDQLANRFARLFVKRSIRPGDRVGIYMPRSGRAIAAMLGALRANAVYVPIDPSSPPARVARLAHDCGIRHMVISPSLLSSFLTSRVSSQIEHFVLSADGVIPLRPEDMAVHSWSEVWREDTSRPLFPSSENLDTLAYILYTSGSSGTPKGVMLSHRNAGSFIEWAADQIELHHGDRVASGAPFHFDLSIFEVWASLWVGATVVILDESTVASGPRMLDSIRKRNISVWYSVPSAWGLMLEHTDLEATGAPSLRAVYFAGEIFPLKQLRRVMRALPRAQFWNLFGPTETNVCLAYPVSAAPREHEVSLPIGFPVCGNRISVLDERGRQAADGEVGQLFVEGPSVMLGYWGSAKTSASKSVYGTGDLVSRRHDGCLFYHGRRDHMVKVRGYRIELSEIELTLSSHPSIQESVALLLDQELVCAVVATCPNLSALQVKQHCAAQVPRHMIPADVRFIRSMPRTANGKTDRALVIREIRQQDEAKARLLSEAIWKRA